MTKLNNKNQPLNTTTMEFSYNQNIETLQAFFKYKVSKETLEIWMSNLSENSRKAIECKFGLIGDSKPCKTFKELNEALGITNSKQVFETAIKELEEVKYILILADSEKFDRKVAVGIGRFAYAAELALRNGDILGEEILNCMKEFSSKEQKMISYRYGFEKGTEEHSLRATAEHFGYKSGENIRQIEVKVLRKFRHPSRVKKISIYYSNKHREEEEAKRQYEKDKAEHPEKYVSLSCLEEQNHFDFKICSSFDWKQHRFIYIYQVANSNPEEIAVVQGISLENAEILYVASKRFDFERHFKFEKVMYKNLEEFEFSPAAKRVISGYWPARIAQTLLGLTDSQIRSHIYATKAVAEEIIQKKNEYLGSFSAEWTVDDLGFTEKTLDVLRKNNIKTLADFLSLTLEQVSNMKGKSKKVIDEFNFVRAKFGQEPLK